MIGVLLSVFIAYGAFILGWIALDAIFAAVILGTIVLGFGGWSLAFAIFFFFVSSSALTHRNKKYRRTQKDFDTLTEDYFNRRDAQQVWANGFWIAVFTILYFMFDSELFIIAAFAAVATATADTWATEIGTRNPGKTKNILTLEKIPPGSDGGVSLKGFLASAIGAISISLFLFGQVENNLSIAIITVSVSGFLGCVMDSYIGALYRDKPMIFFGWNKASITLSKNKNNAVNLMSTGIGAFIAILTYSIIYL